MADESILTYKKPGFPKISTSSTGQKTDIEYVGPYSTLFAAAPSLGGAWGAYVGRVTAASAEPLPGTDQGELTVTVEYEYETAAAGTAREVTYEIEWVSISRSMYEHPQFSIAGSGANKLTTADIAKIEKWKNTQDETEKANYNYETEAGSGIFIALSANAKLFAVGINLGVETWDDYAPVLRKTTTHTNGPPSSSSAGAKETSNPTGFVNIPSGYEWRKSADRSIKAGGQNRWERTEEWLGAKQVLVDKAQVYWTAPI